MVTAEITGTSSSTRDPEPIVLDSYDPDEEFPTFAHKLNSDGSKSSSPLSKKSDRTRTSSTTLEYSPDVEELTGEMDTTKEYSPDVFSVMDVVTEMNVDEDNDLPDLERNPSLLPGPTGVELTDVGPKRRVSRSKSEERDEKARQVCSPGAVQQLRNLLRTGHPTYQHSWRCSRNNVILMMKSVSAIPD